MCELGEIVLIILFPEENKTVLHVARRNLLPSLREIYILNPPIVQLLEISHPLPEKERMLD